MNIKLIEAIYKSKYFDFACELIFAEWGDRNLDNLNAKKEKLKSDTTSKCYVLEINDTPVGCFVVRNNDIKGFEHYNPNLACVCIKKEYRGHGYSNILMEQADLTFKKLDIKKAYLKTDLNNFYEKFGWEYLQDAVIDGKKEKLYKKDFV